MSSSAPSPAQPVNGKPNDTPQKTSTAAADVGWQFVPQYYTMMHDAPERLHCFYNKKSTFVHGVEGEEVAASLGQQAIHQKVLSLGLSNCKAFIHHIDTQPSFQGGILLQVIGEMSNASGPWRKFTQTFFLAEQPNGYYVLNDIFRYLKENDDEQDEESEQGEEEKVEATQPAEEDEETPIVQAAAEPIKVSADILTIPGAPGVSDLAEATAGMEELSVKEEPKEASAAAQEQAEEKPKAQEEIKPETTAEEPVAAATEEKETATESAPAAEAQEKEEKPVPSAPAPAAKQSTSAASPTTTSTSPPPPAAGRRQSPSRGKQAQSPAQAHAQSPAAAPAAPTPAAPPKPRTWASTAAAKPNAWGTALATKEALSAPPITAASALPAVKLGQAEKAAPQQQVKQGQAAGQAQGQGQKFPLVEAAKAVQTAICFVKLNNWQAQDSTEQITETELRRILGKSAGVPPSEITKVEIVRDKACAFVEFAKVDAARRAIIASLMTNQGGGGGIKTDGGHRIIVESRKEKSERKSGVAVGGPAVASGGQAAQQAPVVQQGPAQGQQARRQGSGQNQNQNQNQQNQNQNQNRAGGNAVRGGRGRPAQGQGAQK